MLKVLIAEDELIIADLLEETFIESGYEVCGIARTVDEAVALGVLHEPDLAVLDVRLARAEAPFRLIYTEPRWSGKPASCLSPIRLIALTNSG